jgi:hypothetical protein
MAPCAEPARALFERGNGRLAAGDLPGAAECFRGAVQADPLMAEAHANLAYCLDRCADSAQAEASYRAALALQPARAQILGNFGGFLARHERLEEAESACRRALAADPDCAPACSNLGVLLACGHREAEAESWLRRALAIDPADRVARFNLGYVLLRQGRFEEGWECLDARKDHQPALGAPPPCPRWRGEPLAGKRLLIEFEAGHGDMIQFGRYARLLKEQGAARIGLVCQPALVELFAQLEGVDERIALEGPLAPPFWERWDFWSPLLSLPRRCGTRLDNIPARIPYLRADPQRMRAWAPRLPADGVRVGLVWKGNPNFENDADRSLASLADLAPLWQVPGARFVSLQKWAGEREARLAPADRPLVDLGPAIGDFADTAAIVALLDLVVCVDTAVGHLAGALGKKCWILLPDFKADWRWLRDRGDSPWYPGSVRLFRQERRGDWGPLIERVAAALRDYIRADCVDGGPSSLTRSSTRS